MVELWIDDQRCDIEKIPTLPIEFESERLTKVEGYRTGRTIVLELPATPRNDAIFGSSRDLYATSRFNTDHHRATLKCNNIVIFEGTAYLVATTVKASFEGGYKIRIAEGGAEWIERVAKGLVSNLDIPFAERLDLSTISKSWEGDQAVRFLPVHRGEREPRYTDTVGVVVERVMLTDDYHPFISVAEMVRKMFADSGYTLRSRFFDSEFGRKLYMSGDYSRTDTSSAKSKCDFFARRSAPATEKADIAGRVYASTLFAASSIGPIVDTADPEAFDSDGKQMSECFNTLNAFSINRAGNICFTPKISVKAGFVLHLEYETEYKILSRESFVGFDTVENVVGARVEFPLANTCFDYRNEPKPNWQYRALVFDHTEGYEYKLMADCEGEEQSIGQWNTRSQLVITPDRAISSLRLLARNGGEWQEYEGDWALYAGYLGEEGKMCVEMDLRFPPQDIQAGEEFAFDKLWIGGAEQGMKLTVGTGTTLRPYFTTVPGYGSNLEFKDIAPRQLRQIDLLSALGEMFNLAFYTDRQRKEVHIEPLEDLYDEEVIEWSDRILRHDIEISDTGFDRPQRLVLEYLNTDKATHTFNLENDTTFGRYATRNPLYGTVDSARELGNKLFTTTINATDLISTAPSASILQVGDIGDDNEGIDNPFTLRIVCYEGMRELPEGEWWIAGNKRNRYPYVAFSDGESINLCFEDRGDVEGLHRYYDKAFARQCEGQNITLDLRLTTAEMATLFTAEGTIPSVRKRFRLTIQGESSIFRLAKVERWDAESDIVRCTFERELND